MYMEQAKKYELTVQAVDCILYNRQTWRAAVKLLEPHTSTSIVLLPVVKTPGDPVGNLAVSRATITCVLDIVDRSLRSLPKEYQRIAKMKWDEFRSYKSIANAMSYSEKTVQRRIERIRNIVKGALESAPKSILPAFWREIDLKLS